MTNKPMPEPFSYFKAGPFGWTVCAETDQGAIPLYDAAIVYAYAKTCADAEAKRIFDEGMTTVGHMREQIAKAVEAEREAGAYIAEGYPKYGESIAEEIRARSQA